MIEILILVILLNVGTLIFISFTVYKMNQGVKDKRCREYDVLLESLTRHHTSVYESTREIEKRIIQALNLKSRVHTLKVPFPLSKENLHG